MNSEPLEVAAREMSLLPPSRRSCCTTYRWRWFLAATLVLLAVIVAVTVPLLLRKDSESLSYDQDRARRLAILAGAAYCSTDSLEAWNCGSKCIDAVRPPVKVCVGETTSAFVTRYEDTGFVSFQGTKSYLAMIQDLRTIKSSTPWDLCGNCTVHAGFLIEWQSLSVCVKTWLAAIGSASPSQIQVTGHSLGGAVAALAMIDLVANGWKIKHAYTFGMPRVGDGKFASTFNDLQRGSFYRVTHHMDPVPHLPLVDFGFQHVSGEVFYNGNVSSGYRLCVAGDDELCSAQYWNVPYDMLYIVDHLDYMGEQTTSIGCEDILAGIFRPSDEVMHDGFQII